MERPLIIRNGLILTFGKTCRVYEGWDLLIEGEKIARICPSGQILGAFENSIDARGRVVMPGLINAHTHFYSAMARGMPNSVLPVNFKEVLEKYWWRLDCALTLEDIRFSARIHLLEAVRNGCTTLVDHHSSPGAIPGSLDVIAEEVKAAGLRACLCYEVSDRNGEAALEEALEENSRFLSRCNGNNDPHLRALFGLHAPFTLSNESLEKASKRGSAFGAGFHVHVAEAGDDRSLCLEKYGARPLERLDAFNLLGSKTLAIHCVHLDEQDLDCLARRGASIIHNPQSNLNNAVGVADVQKMVSHGIAVGLGTDGMGACMLEEARTALWCQHWKNENPSVGLDAISRALTATNPEIASRLWGVQIGEIAPGAAADLVITNYLPVTPLNEENAMAHLIHGISQTSMDTTICAGRILMQKGQLQMPLCRDEWVPHARNAASSLWARISVGVQP